MRAKGFLCVLGVLICACASPPGDESIQSRPMSALPGAGLERGELEIEIHVPEPDLLLTRWETSLEVRGGASVFGGVKYLDLMLVLDSSQSLQRSDPRNHRTVGAVGLVKSLLERGEVKIGVVDFDRKAELLAALTTDREQVIAALRKLDRRGTTDLGKGVVAALAELEQNGRPGSSRVILLFTDGKTNEKKAREAMLEARRRGVAIHTLLLGSHKKGAAILQEIADGTGASFIHVTDPEGLPEAFLSLRTTGVEEVSLSVNGSPPIPAELRGGTFTARVPLELGSNRISATATSLGGLKATQLVRVSVSGPMRVEIEGPRDGTLIEYRSARTLVEGSVDAFVDLPAAFPAAPAEWDVASVVLQVNDSEPVPALVTDGRFRAQVTLVEGENRIVARARSRDGRSVGHTVQVKVESPGCAELRVSAKRDGRPALSLSDRSVEIVVDASNSMWGQIKRKPKISIAKEVLESAMDWLPDDVALSLRVYGHRHKRELHNCTDSELLVPFGAGNRGSIRDAIAGFKPRGQTPLAYSLERVAADFGDRVGERAVVLVTDGIESCGGDPVAAARALQEHGSFPVHVIGFGLASALDADPASLKAIAAVSGGRFVSARSAAELRDALSVTVGTPFKVFRGGEVVAESALGSGDRVLLPKGDYRVRLESAPPHEFSVSLTSEKALEIVLEREADEVTSSQQVATIAYTRCEQPVPAALP